VFELPPRPLEIPSVTLPSGYEYRITRHADVILAGAFDQAFGGILNALSGFSIAFEEIIRGGWESDVDRGAI
jgi:hypothetical protein